MVSLVLLVLSWGWEAGCPVASGGGRDPGSRGHGALSLASGSHARISLCCQCPHLPVPGSVLDEEGEGSAGHLRRGSWSIPLLAQLQEGCCWVLGRPSSSAWGRNEAAWAALCGWGRVGRCVAASPSSVLGVGVGTHSMSPILIVPDSVLGSQPVLSSDSSQLPRA